MSSWHARAAILNYTQVMVFGNLFLLQQPQLVKEIQQLVLRLLCDEQVEVGGPPCIDPPHVDPPGLYTNS